VPTAQLAVCDMEPFARVKEPQQKIKFSGNDKSNTFARTVRQKHIEHKFPQTSGDNVPASGSYHSSNASPAFFPSGTVICTIAVFELTFVIVSLVSNRSASAPTRIGRISMIRKNVNLR